MANEQYFRQECLEMLGIPESIQDDDLEDYVLKIFNQCDTPLDQSNIEVCNHAKPKARPKKVIIKLSLKGMIGSDF